MLKATIKDKTTYIPLSYKELTLRIWLDLKKNKETDFANFFLGRSYSTLSIQEQQIFSIALSFLNNDFPPILPPHPIDISQKSISQKIDALIELKQLANNLEQALPHIYAIFVQDSKTYNEDEYKQQLNYILEQPFHSAYSKCLNYANALIENEKFLSKVLKKVSYSNEQVLAGIKDLEITSNLNFILTIAERYRISKYKAEKVSIEEANALLILINRNAAFQKKLQEVYNKKLKAKNK